MTIHKKEDTSNKEVWVLWWKSEVWGKDWKGRKKVMQPKEILSRGPIMKKWNKQDD